MSMLAVADGRRLTALQVILYGTVVVGTLDILDAFVFFGLRSGATPIRILHSIAAGLLGRESAVQGGLPAAALGAFLHFFIAFCVVATYWLASRRLPGLVEHPVVAGVFYGIAVYWVMNLIVIPLSAIGARPALPPLPVLINGLTIHMLGVGLPSALFARAGTEHVTA